MDQIILNKIAQKGQFCLKKFGAVYILYSKITTDPGLLKIRHSHRFVAVVIQILIPFV